MTKHTNQKSPLLCFVTKLLSLVTGFKVKAGGADTRCCAAVISCGLVRCSKVMHTAGANLQSGKVDTRSDAEARWSSCFLVSLRNDESQRTPRPLGCSGTTALCSVSHQPSTIFISFSRLEPSSKHSPEMHFVLIILVCIIYEAYPLHKNMA